MKIKFNKVSLDWFNDLKCWLVLYWNILKTIKPLTCVKVRKGIVFQKIKLQNEKIYMVPNKREDNEL